MTEFNFDAKLSAAELYIKIKFVGHLFSPSCVACLLPPKLGRS